ncbi:MAG: PilW family protein [Massilia sp.]|nr:PilW family protein [Massilia sp.]
MRSLRQTRQTRRAGGFSLVELMVSVVIGMLALMFATRLFSGAEQNRQAALGGSDAMQNGMLAMFSISNDAAQAGYGLNDPIITGCDTILSDTNGYVLAPASRGGLTISPLAAAVIESNGADPDRISLYSASSMSGTGTLRITTTIVPGADLVVDRVPYGFARNDVVVIAPENNIGKCALAQISSDPSALPLPPVDQKLTVAPVAGTRFNCASLGATFQGGVARLFNLGPARNLNFHTWSVAGGFLQLRATDLDGASAAPSTVVDNIVSIKAQYGFDTRTGVAFDPQAGMQMGVWSPSMIDADADADADGSAGGAADYQRITALRIAVVARSKAPQRPAPGAVCSATTTLPRVFASAAPVGVAAVPVAVNVAVAGDPLDWKCYRYRVFETVVPLRNSAWRPTA